MGTIQSVAGWAIVAAVTASGCSTSPADTDVAELEVTTRRNNSKTEQSYVAVASASETAVTPPVSSEMAATLDTSVDAMDAGLETSTFSDEGNGSSDVWETDAGAESTAGSADAPSVGPETTPPETPDAGETHAEPTCRETAGLCDPVGDCALSDCDFEQSGKSCAYTPERTYPFMCVGTANFEPYRPCDTDDACAPGSVCISKIALLKDGSFYRRPGAVCRETCRQDADCGEGEWCTQATDDNNEVIPDMRVCHRHCNTEADCYVGEGDEEVRCSNSVEGAPPSTFECSRYRPPVAATAPATEPTAVETSDAQSTVVAYSSASHAAEANAIDLDANGAAFTLYALRVQATAGECVFNEDCSADADCVDGTCQPRCDTDEDCDGAECVVVSGRGICGAPCEKPEGTACGLVPSNCGCEIGETCHLDGALVPTCSAPGPNPAMSWCNWSTDCDTGLSCISGLCRPLCDPETHPCNAADGECVRSVATDAGDVFACAGSCDPVDAPDCGSGAVCIPGFDVDHHHQALCAAERSAQRPRKHGETCAEDYDCATGLGCDVNAVCRPWCRDDSDCAEGLTCKLDASNLGSFVTRFGSSVSDLVGLCQMPN